MSIRNILASAAAVICGTLLGYNGVKLYNSTYSAPRGLASVPITKLAGEQFARSIFDVQLNLKGLAKSDAEISQIRVSISALKNIESGLNFKWNLPPDAQIVSGALSDQVGALQVGETKEFLVELKGFSKELKKYVSFEITGQQGSLPIKSEVLVSSRVEDSIEYLIQQSELKNRANGFNKLDAGQRKSKFAPENIVK